MLNQMILLLQQLRESNSRIDLNAQKANEAGQGASTRFTESERNWAAKQLIEQNTSTAKIQNSLLQSEFEMFQKAPELLSIMRLLKERGLSVGSGLDLYRTWKD